MSEQQQCGNCHFWREFEPADGPIQARGRCRYSHAGERRATDSDDWCGKWELTRSREVPPVAPDLSVPPTTCPTCGITSVPGAHERVQVPTTPRHYAPCPTCGVVGAHSYNCPNHPPTDPLGIMRTPTMAELGLKQFEATCPTHGPWRYVSTDELGPEQCPQCRKDAKDVEPCTNCGIIVGHRVGCPYA